MKQVFWVPLVIAAISQAAQADILAKADMAYGEYLSGECVTCHRADGGDEGIPRLLALMLKVLRPSCLPIKPKTLTIP